MSTGKSNAPRITFDVFKRRVLDELKDRKRYRHFSGTVAAFMRAGGIDKFAQDLFPMLKACWQQGYSVEKTAGKLDDLTDMIKMRGALYVAEVKSGNEGQDV